MTTCHTVTESIPTPPVANFAKGLGRESPAREYVVSPPDALAGGSGTSLWCDHCELVITVPAYDVRHTHTCECKGELKQIHNCADCNRPVSHITHDFCDDCIAKWQRIERADELRSTLIDIALSPWGAWPGAGYRLISGGKSKGVRIPAPSTIESIKE